MAAAIALIDESDDPASLTLRGIAHRVGITAPAIYAHFPDLAAVIARACWRPASMSCVAPCKPRATARPAPWLP